MGANDSDQISEGPLWMECHRVVGCAFEVLNTLGPGLHEKAYENALVVEFGLKGIASSQQARFPVVYKDVKVAEYVPDLLAMGSLVIDTKVIDRITDHERAKMLTYLRITGLEVGLIINFRRPKLEWQRVIRGRDH